MASPASPAKDEQPPSKKLKRAYNDDAGEAPAFEPLPKKRISDAIKLENTPPPSPPAERASIEMADDEAAVPRVVDMEGINDEIVEAVITQLQNTGNRPHLVKELAAVLIQHLKIVQQ